VACNFNLQAAFLNLQAAFCLRGYGLFKTRQQAVVLRVSFDGKMKPFFYPQKDIVLLKHRLHLKKKTAVIMTNPLKIYLFKCFYHFQNNVYACY